MTPETATDKLTKIFQDTRVPMLGFGTYELTGTQCTNAVQTALEVGYRHIDTARAYGNEIAVGAALARKEIERDEIFLTSKIWFDALEPKQVKEEVHASLKDLQIDYLDLVLIHWPSQITPLESTLDALQELVEQELIQHYGVSNFPPSWFKRVLNHGSVFCNQVEYHPLFGQKTLLQISEEHDVMLTAYAPLGQGALLEHEAILAIARKYDVTAGEVCIRWLLDQPQVTTIPRSSTAEHIRTNFRALQLQLDKDDRQRINALPKDQRMVNPSFAPAWET